MSTLEPFLAELSTIARAITLGAPTPSADNKAGEGAYDPVTILDRSTEQALRAAIAARFPDDGIEGEEYGIERPEAPRRWLIDPIDGTRALVCGLPSWTTLIALCERGEPTHGSIDAPAVDQLFIGGNGRTTCNGAVVRTSGCETLAEARLATTDPYLFDDQERAAFTRVRREARLTRYGLDAFAYARLAAGTIDLIIESGLKTHDWAALVPVVRGAGGWIGDWRGGEEFAGGAIVAAATRTLYDDTVTLLARS